MQKSKSGLESNKEESNRGYGRSSSVCKLVVGVSVWGRLCENESRGLVFKLEELSKYISRAMGFVLYEMRELFL